MIDPKEVRIGNLVVYNNRVFEIYSIEKEFPTLYTPEFGICVADWNNIEPIPITEYCLLKFGFDVEYHKNGNSYKREIDNISGHIFEIIFINKGNLLEPIWLVMYGGGGYHDSIPAKIKYVHQLQNLYFALTGEELILNKVS